jgi:predicted HicB family RNase H-like nuclease
MKKGITIDGCTTLKGTTANVLNIAAASKGISLVEYIRQVLNDKAKGLKSKD